uniref:Uncharacterized protein n=1 Tax=Oryza meridionalis TaxID=40149 RepID=A0A0E0DMA6_9ORYZ
MARTMSSVSRGAVEFVAPARATPYEFKPLSDIDDQEGLRFYRSSLFLYRRCAAKDGVDPVTVLRAALAEALVRYYPLAGHIVEASPGRKLLVECTGEGAVFVAAESGVAMEELGEEFLCAADGGIVGRPLLYFQVTRMRCGGFVLGILICHCITDAAGVAQFMTAVGEFARGLPGAPTVKPVWARRELLSARRPPPRDVATRHHPEYEPVPDATRDKFSPSDALVHRPFFGRREIATLHALAPPSLASRSSRFDLIAAFMWRCCANALQYDAADAVRVQFVMNTRGRGRGRSNAPLLLPDGYYGNAFAFAVAESPVGELHRRPFAHALLLVVDAKARAMEEGHLQSVADLMAARGRPRFAVARTYVVLDITRAGFNGLDVGWGTPVYGGPARKTPATFHIAGRRNGDSEEGIEVHMRLPAPVMERMVAEVARELGGVDAHTEASLAAKL